MHVPNTSIPDAITFANASMTPIFISPMSTPLTTSPTSLQNLSLRLLFSDCVHSSDFATSLRIFHLRRSYCAHLFLVSSLFLIHLILHFSSHSYSSHSPFFISFHLISSHSHELHFMLPLHRLLFTLITSLVLKLRRSFGDYNLCPSSVIRSCDPSCILVLLWSSLPQSHCNND